MSEKEIDVQYDVTTQHSVDAQNNITDEFNINQYNDYLTSEEYRREQVERLSETNRSIKLLNMEKLQILKGLSDSETNTKLLGVVKDVYTGVLERNAERVSVEDIINECLTEDNVMFLNDNKNKPHFPSDKVFDHHIEHPVQKKLVKKKHMSKRALKKNKTPMQTIKYVHNAKKSNDIQDRLEALEQKMVDMEYSLSVLAASQVDVYKAQDKLEEAVQGMFVEIKYKLSEVERVLKIAQTKKVEDKLKLYSMYTSRKSLTIREMSKELGVSERTVDYWLSELRELLGIK